MILFLTHCDATWLSYFLDVMLHFMKETAGDRNAFSPMMRWHRCNNARPGKDFCLTEGKAGKLGHSLKAPGETIQVVLAIAMPQLSHLVQLSELGWELSFSGAAWKKVGLPGWPDSYIMWQSLIFFGLYGPGLGHCHGASKLQGAWVWKLPSFRHPLISSTS